jgi:phage gp46-like protein
MPDQWLVSLVTKLRARAEELSVRADSFHDEEAREKMHRIAETYEKLAQRLEQHARDANDWLG